MKPTLTITFESLAELQEYLSVNPEAASQKVASTQPSTAQVVELHNATAAPAAAPAAAPQPTVDAATAAAPVTKEELMVTLKNLAGSLDDPSVLGAFVNSFGVAKFSDLPESELPKFAAELKNQFGV